MYRTTRPFRTPGPFSPQAASVSSGAVSYDADAQTYFDAITTAGSTISDTHKNAYNTFILGLKSNSLYTLFDFIAPLLGNDLTAARVPAKHPVSLAAMTNANFVSGDYSTTTGLTGNGTSKSIDTGWNPSSAGNGTNTNFHLSCYLRSMTQVAYTEATAIGANQTSRATFVTPTRSAGGLQAQIANVSCLTAQRTRLYGLYVGNRASTTTAAYMNGVSLVTATNATSQLVGQNIRLFARGGASTDRWHAGTFCFFSGGQSLDATQQATFNTLVEAFVTACGRGYTAPTISVPLNSLILTGQSLAAGLQSTNASMYYPARSTVHYMFPNGSKPGTSDPGGLVEYHEFPNGTSADGTIGNQTVFGSMLAALADYDATHHCLAFGNPKSATNYTGLKKGSAPYSATTTQATYADTYATSGHKVRAIINVHGEADDLTGASSYATDLTTWQSDYDTDLKAITGQAEDVAFIYSQTAAWGNTSSRTTTVAAIKQLDAHEADTTNMILTGPKYFLATDDGTHLTADSERWLGEYCAKAYAAKVIDGGSFSPLRPLSVTRSGADITVVFNKGGLTFDTTLVTDPSGSYASRKFGTAYNSADDTTVVNKLGFEFCDDNTTNPSASISGFNGQGLVVANINANFGTTNITGDTLTVNLSGTPTSTNKRLRYAYSYTSGFLAGPSTGARGCLRDADTSFTFPSGNTSYNWCVTFDKAAT